MPVFVKSFIAIFVIAGMGFAVYRAATHPIFELNEIEIRPMQASSANLLFERIHGDLAIRMLTYRGKPLWDLDLEMIMKEIERDLRIKEAKVTRSLPNSLQILIQPHTPVAVIMNNKMNKFYPVARNGEVLPSVSIGEAHDGPILKGDAFLKDQELRGKALEVLRLLPERGIISLKSVSDVTYDKRLGFQLRVNPFGVQVLLGHEGYASRVKHARRVMEYLRTEELNGRVIDARFSKKVVVKLRNEP